MAEPYVERYRAALAGQAAGALSRAMRTRPMWCALAGCILASCGSMHAVRSSLYMPCRAKEIAISQETYGGGEETWIATCRGRDYACSAITVGNKVNYRCRPLPTADADAGATGR